MAFLELTFCSRKIPDLRNFLLSSFSYLLCLLLSWSEKPDANIPEGSATVPIPIIGFCLITSNEFYLSILKYICSGYLLYLGVSSVMRTSSFEYSSNGSKWSNTNGFAVGLITNITNIKAFLFFITLFGVVLNTDNTERLIIYGLYMALATFIWFSFIGYVFTSQVFKSRFIKFFGYFEKGLGLILVIIAMQLIISEYL